MAGEEKDLGTGRTGGREATTGVIPGRVALSVGCPDLEPPKGWKWTMLSSVAQLESGHTPSRKHPEYWDEGIPWIGIKDATENHGRTLSDTYQHVSALGLENSSARLLPANTVCLSRTASVGFVVVMGRPMATSQDFVNWVCGPNIEAHYLKYVLLAENEALWRFASGTTHQTIYYPEAKAFHVCLPPLAEQKAIAAVLGALDDKIELNRRMNATLEAMARALFQSWFVDFDPVRAKLDGRPPAALDPATAALFPASFQESALGEIPKGWTAGTVVEGFNLTMGQSPPGDTYNEEENGVPFYQGRTDFGFRFPTRRIYCSAPTRYAKPGDTLVSVRAPVGAINMANEECCIGRGVAAVRHKSGATSFTYHSMANLYPDFARFEAEGTVFGSINKDSFEKLRFVIPPDEIVAAYERQAGPLDEQIRTLENQSRTLATLRDTLLPKLLSGELSVAEATGNRDFQVQPGMPKP